MAAHPVPGGFMVGFSDGNLELRREDGKPQRRAVTRDEGVPVLTPPPPKHRCRRKR